MCEKEKGEKYFVCVCLCVSERERERKRVGEVNIVCKGTLQILRIFSNKVSWDECCIFRPALGCCTLQTLVEIVIFSVFNAKKLKKQEICSKFCKKLFFKVFTKTLVNCFIHKKLAFSKNDITNYCQAMPNQISSALDIIKNLKWP